MALRRGDRRRHLRLYTSGLRARRLPGGWIADRLIGQRRAVLYRRHPHRARATSRWPFRPQSTFYLGLLLIVLGTGLLKPNISVIVGELYADKGDRAATPGSRSSTWASTWARSSARCSARTSASRATGATWVNWHYGFAAAGVGMTLGSIQYTLGDSAI